MWGFLTVVYSRYPWMSWTSEGPHYHLYQQGNNPSTTAAYDNRLFLLEYALNAWSPSCRALHRPSHFLCMCGWDTITSFKSSLTLYTRKKIPSWISRLIIPQQQWESSFSCLRTFISFRGSHRCPGGNSVSFRASSMPHAAFQQYQWFVSQRIFRIPLIQTQPNITMGQDLHRANGNTDQSFQADSRIDLKIAWLSSRITVSTQQDSSSKIMCLNWFFHLPRTCWRK